MPLQDSVLSEKEEMLSLVRQKQRIEETLTAAGGRDFSFLLAMCNDLSDIIDDMEEIRLKMHKKEHAAFMTKVKFSRKLRRKAKDLHLFEEELVREFELEHISLEFGRKMGEIVKLLKSNNVEKAREKAEEFYNLQEMGEKLEVINDTLLKKKALTERAKRDVESLLSDLEWLEKEPEPNLEKAGRHEQRAHLLRKLHRIRLEHIEALKSMPLPELLVKARDGELHRFGFPQIPAAEAERLVSFLRKNGLGAKTSAQLLELVGQSEQKLRHLFVDLAEFRRMAAGRRAFFEQIETLHSSGFLDVHSADAPARAYLSSEYAGAKEAVEWLSELAKTAGEDAKEWERVRLIEQKRTNFAEKFVRSGMSDASAVHDTTGSDIVPKHDVRFPRGKRIRHRAELCADAEANSTTKAKLAGIDEAALRKSMQELETLEKILDGKAQPEPVKEERKKEGNSGIIEGILGFFR